MQPAVRSAQVFMVAEQKIGELAIPAQAEEVAAPAAPEQAEVDVRERARRPLIAAIKAFAELRDSVEMTAQSILAGLEGVAPDGEDADGFPGHAQRRARERLEDIAHEVVSFMEAGDAARARAIERVAEYEGAHAEGAIRLGMRDRLAEFERGASEWIQRVATGLEAARIRLRTAAGVRATETVRLLEAGHGQTELRVMDLVDDATICIEELRHYANVYAREEDQVAAATRDIFASDVGRTSASGLTPACIEEVAFAWLQINSYRLSQRSQEAEVARARLSDLADSVSADGDWAGHGPRLANALNDVPGNVAVAEALEEAGDHIRATKEAIGYRPGNRYMRDMKSEFEEAYGSINDCKAAMVGLSTTVERIVALVSDHLARVANETGMPLRLPDIDNAATRRREAARAALAVGSAASGAAARRGVSSGVLDGNAARLDAALAWLGDTVVEIKKAHSALDQLRSLESTATESADNAASLRGIQSPPRPDDLGAVAEWAARFAAETSAHVRRLAPLGLAIQAAAKTARSLRDLVHGLGGVHEMDNDEHRSRVWTEFNEEADRLDGAITVAMDRFDTTLYFMRRNHRRLVETHIGQIQAQCGAALDELGDRHSRSSPEDRERARARARRLIQGCNDAVKLLAGSTEPPVAYDVTVINEAARRAQPFIGQIPADGHSLPGMFGGFFGRAQ